MSRWIYEQARRVAETEQAKAKVEIRARIESRELDIRKRKNVRVSNGHWRVS